MLKFLFLSLLLGQFGGSRTRTPKLSPVPNTKQFTQQEIRHACGLYSPRKPISLQFATLTACRRKSEAKLGVFRYNIAP
jgi:hypothetical protein